MIIEIIIVSLLLLSFIGLILFAIFFFKHKKHVDRKKSDMLVERILDGKTIKIPRNLFHTMSLGERFFDWSLRNAGKITFICFIIVFINMTFHPFFPSTTKIPTITPAAVPTPIPVPVNNNVQNNSLSSIFNVLNSASPVGLPWWLFIIIFGTPLWIVWRMFRRSSYEFM